MLKVAHHTSLVAALFLTIWLKVLHLFKLMPWHPTSFLKTTTTEPFFRYIILFALLYGGIFILFILFAGLPTKFLFIQALIIGLVISYLFISWFENAWLVGAQIREANIPFTVTVLLLVRFLVETATFHRKESKHFGYKKPSSQENS